MSKSSKSKKTVNPSQPSRADKLIFKALQGVLTAAAASKRKSVAAASSHWRIRGFAVVKV